MNQYSVTVSDQGAEEIRYFFNSVFYLNQQEEPRYTFTLLSSQNPLCQIIFSLKGTIASSPIRAPFGGIELFTNSVSKDGLLFLFEYVIVFFKKLNITTLKIGLPPNFYFNQNDICLVLSSLSTKIIKDITYYWETSKEVGFNKTQKKKLNRLKKTGFFCEKLAFSKIPEAYSILDNQFKAKGYPLTMSEYQLQKAFNNFPNQYTLYGVYTKLNELCAVCFCVDVGDNIQYLMYNANKIGFEKQSPLVLLYEFMHQEAVKNGMKYLDFGIATDGGEVNEGLTFFKKSLGGIPSTKMTYYFELN